MALGGVIRQVTLQVLGDRRGAENAINWTNAAADKLQARKVTLDIDAKTPVAKLAALGTLLDGLQHMAKTIKVSVDDKPSLLALARIGQALTLLQARFNRLSSQGDKLNINSLNKLDVGLRKADADFQNLIVNVDKFNTSLDEIAVSGKHATVGFGWFAGAIPLFASATLSVGLLHFAFDAAIEAIIAVGTALAALGVGLYGISAAAVDVYNHLKAVDAVNDAFGQHIAPLTGKLRAFQFALAPAALEIYGGAINAITNKSGILGRVMGEVANMFDDWIAKIDIWSKSQNSWGQLLQTGVGFLHQFAQIIGNVLLAINNLMKADPGIAHFLMDVLVGLSRVLVLFSELPKPIIYLTLGLHGLYIWGGLAVTALSRLAGVTGITKLATAMGILKTETVAAGTSAEVTETRFLGMSGAMVGVIAAIAASIGLIVYEGTRALPAVDHLITTLNAGLGNDNAAQALVGISIAIGRLQAQLSQGNLQKSLNSVFNPPAGWGAYTAKFHAMTYDVVGDAKNLGHALNMAFSTTDYRSTLDAFGNFFKGLFSDSAGRAQATAASISDVNHQIDTWVRENGALYGQIYKLMQGTTRWNLNIKTTGDTLGETSNMFKKTTTGAFSFNQALTLMDLANVKYNDSAAVMAQKIQNLITGYANMGVQAGILQNGVNAVTFATEFQASKVNQLTAAYSTFMGVVQGSENGLVTFGQGLQAQATAAKAAGASYTGLNANSLALRASFNSNISSANSLFVALVNQGAAANLGTRGYHMLTQAGKDLVGSLLAGAKGSQANTAQLYALAQEAGYHGVDSFKALSAWVGTTHDRMKNLDNITTIFTKDSSNLAVDVKNLANAVNQNLNQAMAQGIFLASGGVTAFKNFADAVLHAHGNVQDMISPARALWQELLANTNNAADAKKEFFAFMVQLHLTRGEADRLWASLHRLGTEREYPKVFMTGTGTYKIYAGNVPGGTGGGAGQHPAHKVTIGGAASGARIPGYGGGDRHLILAEGGEAIVPKELTPHLAPVLKAWGVPGFAAGGVVGAFGPTGDVSALGPYAIRNYQAFVNVMAGAMGTAMKNALTMAINNAMKQASTFGGGLGRQGLRYLENLWMSAGGPGGGTAHVAAAIALAESGGNPMARNPSGASGLWQILGQVVPGNIFNPFVNALNAVKKYRDAGGFSPWVTFETGAYRQFMGRGGTIREPIFGIGRSGRAYGFGESGIETVIPGSLGNLEVAPSAYRTRHATGDTYNITVQGDTNPDAAALRIIQLIRDRKRRHGNQPTGIG
jgi:lysozyme-like protein